MEDDFDVGQQSDALEEEGGAVLAQQEAAEEAGISAAAAESTGAHDAQVAQDEVGEQQEEAEGQAPPDIAALRELYAQAEAKREEEAARVARFTQLMASSGYGDSPDDILLNIEAHQRGIEPAQLKQELAEREQQRAALREEIKNTDPEIVALREQAEAAQQQMRARVFSEDLAAVKAHNPKEQAKSIAELGPLFATLRAQGAKPVDAYDAAMLIKNRSAAPPSTGDVASSGSAADKEFFTQEEVERMSPAEVSKHLDKIEASQKRW